jgi:hypothetical protein
MTEGYYRPVGELVHPPDSKPGVCGFETHLADQLFLTPDGGIGRRGRLKICCRKACRFESDSGDHFT